MLHTVEGTAFGGRLLNSLNASNLPFIQGKNPQCDTHANYVKVVFHLHRTATNSPHSGLQDNVDSTVTFNIPPSHKELETETSVLLIAVEFV